MNTLTIVSVVLIVVVLLLVLLWKAINPWLLDAQVASIFAQHTNQQRRFHDDNVQLNLWEQAALLIQAYEKAIQQSRDQAVEFTAKADQLETFGSPLNFLDIDTLTPKSPTRAPIWDGAQPYDYQITCQEQAQVIYAWRAAHTVRLENGECVTYNSDLSPALITEPPRNRPFLINGHEAWGCVHRLLIPAAEPLNRFDEPLEIHARVVYRLVNHSRVVHPEYLNTGDHHWRHVQTIFDNSNNVLVIDGIPFYAFTNNTGQLRTSSMLAAPPPLTAEQLAQGYREASADPDAPEPNRHDRFQRNIEYSEEFLAWHANEWRRTHVPGQWNLTPFDPVPDSVQHPVPQEIPIDTITMVQAVWLRLDYVPIEDGDDEPLETEQRDGDFWFQVQGSVAPRPLPELVEDARRNPDNNSLGAMFDGDLGTSYATEGQFAVEFLFEFDEPMFLQGMRVESVTADYQSKEYIYEVFADSTADMKEVQVHGWPVGQPPSTAPVPTTYLMPQFKAFSLNGTFLPVTSGLTPIYLNMGKSIRFVSLKRYQQLGVGIADIRFYGFTVRQMQSAVSHYYAVFQRLQNPCEKQEFRQNALMLLSEETKRENAEVRRYDQWAELMHSFSDTILPITTFVSDKQLPKPINATLTIDYWYLFPNGEPLSQTTPNLIWFDYFRPIPDLQLPIKDHLFTYYDVGGRNPRMSTEQLLNQFPFMLYEGGETPLDPFPPATPLWRRMLCNDARRWEVQIPNREFSDRFFSFVFDFGRVCWMDALLFRFPDPLRRPTDLLFRKVASAEQAFINTWYEPFTEQVFASLFPDPREAERWAAFRNVNQTFVQGWRDPDDPQRITPWLRGPVSEDPTQTEFVYPFRNFARWLEIRITGAQNPEQRVDFEYVAPLGLVLEPEIWATFAVQPSSATAPMAASMRVVEFTRARYHELLQAQNASDGPSPEALLRLWASPCGANYQIPQSNLPVEVVPVGK